LAGILGNVSVVCSFVIGVGVVSAAYLVVYWSVYSAMVGHALWSVVGDTVIDGEALQIVDVSL